MKEGCGSCDEEAAYVEDDLVGVDERSPAQIVTAQAGQTARAHPAIYELGRNSLSAVVDALRSKGKTRPKEEREAFFDICETNECGYYDQQGYRCFKCGCFLRIKTWLKAWHCPIDKW